MTRRILSPAALWAAAPAWQVAGTTAAPQAQAAATPELVWAAKASMPTARD